MLASVKNYTYLCNAFPKSGCSSARLEYASGGRVVGSSNLLTPTKLQQKKGLTQRVRPFYLFKSLRIVAPGQREYIIQSACGKILNTDFTAHRLDNPVDERQPKSGTAIFT